MRRWPFGEYLHREKDMAVDSIGVIGLGQMGRGIAENLAKSARAVSVWDIDAAARAPFERARPRAPAPFYIALSMACLPYVPLLVW